MREQKGQPVVVTTATGGRGRLSLFLGCCCCCFAAAATSSFVAFGDSRGAGAASADCSPWFCVAIVVVLVSRWRLAEGRDRSGCGGEAEGSRSLLLLKIATPVRRRRGGEERIGGAAAKEGAEVEQPAEAVTLPIGRIQESERGGSGRALAERRRRRLKSLSLREC